MARRAFERRSTGRNFKRAFSSGNDEMDSSRDSRGIDVPESPCAPEGSGE
jgi:hypothetical protein